MPTRTHIYPHQQRTHINKYTHAGKENYSNKNKDEYYFKISILFCVYFSVTNIDDYSVKNNEIDNDNQKGSNYSYNDDIN